MEDLDGERSSFIVGLIENRAKEVGVAAIDLRSASLHLSQYIETSGSYQNTKTMLQFYDPMVIIVPPNKLAPDGMVGVSELVDRFCSVTRKFMMEMKETAFIMQNVSHRSLIVMDELGRATSSSDGFAIACSCCQHLLGIKAYTIFATHMETLSELAIIYPNVKILHFYVDIKNNRMDFKFQLKDELRHVPHYGLMLAGVAGLHASVIQTAKSITLKITEKEMRRMQVNARQYNDIQMAYTVAQKLICLKYSNKDDEKLCRILRRALLMEGYSKDILKCFSSSYSGFKC